MYLSLIIDGMDQDKTDIPHIISNPKAMAGCYTLETHVTGVRAHGQCTLMVIDCGQFPHDSNLTIEAMLQLLHRLKVYMHIILCTCFVFAKVVEQQKTHKHYHIMPNDYVLNHELNKFTSPPLH